MVVRSVMLLVFVLASVAGYSQQQDSIQAKAVSVPTTKKKTSRPDIPGSIVVELGLNFKNGVVPPDFQKGFWGSRTLNIYYQYQIRILKSRFSFTPGIGLSLERWKFTNNYTLTNSPVPDGVYAGTYALVPANSLYPGVTINRSQLINNYIEMPLELRYDTAPEDIARSINLAFGARFGILYDSFTKIDYSEGGEDKSIKNKQNHGMNTLRYGLYGRIGVGGFGIFSYVNMSPMFQDNKGPIQTSMNSVTIGISVNGF